ncbi:MAG: type II toxin-antitoxin system mRNA interferase toxin, RelE/StbE family [Methanophagales archaeon ANME-1-THS]|nr:MAG: type II toxin-antitoxin system mRNA interferase toxin, RelE/StbE family [Methanophagales archaeon ANME-1-THS]
MKIVISDELTRTLKRLKRRDLTLFTQVQNKLSQIATFDEASINHFKNLRSNMSNYKRVHIGSFVLLFRVEKDKDTIIFDRLVHHDDVY